MKIKTKTFTYKGKKYTINKNRPVLTEKDQHRIQQSFINGELLLAKYKAAQK